MAKEEGTPNPFRYVGKYGVMDEDNGLLFMRARYYDTETGRFLSKDPLRGELVEPGTLNRYVYVLGNPVMGVDPRGLEPITICMGVYFGYKTARSAIAVYSLRKNLDVNLNNIIWLREQQNRYLEDKNNPGGKNYEIYWRLESKIQERIANGWKFITKFIIDFGLSNVPGSIGNIWTGVTTLKDLGEAQEKLDN